MNRGQDAAVLRAQTQQAALFELLKGGITTAGTDQAFRALTEAAAKTLGVSRVAIWLFSADHSRLVLADQYTFGEREQAGGLELLADRLPAYFEALRTSRVIAAPDAETDPRTCEFGSGYLEARGVVSLLDAGIWQAAEPKGVVCATTASERRDWTLDEQQFACSIADLAAAALDYERLTEAQSRLAESEELFSRAVRASPDPISIVRLTDNRILHVNESFLQVGGFQADELIGHSAAEHAAAVWVNPHDRERFIGRLRGEGLVRDFETDLRTRAGNVRAFRLSGYTIEISGDPCVVMVGRDVTEQKRQERLVFEIAQGLSAEIGESFFRSLVVHLTRALDADFAFVGEIDPDDGRRIRTIAMQADAHEHPNISYELAGSPSEAVMGRGVSAYPSGVCGQFPLDRGLSDERIEAYAGAPLKDSRGQALGLIAVMFRRPLDNLVLAENLLRIFAARASAELERRQQLRELEHLALHDALTGLPNRARFKQDAEAGLQRVLSEGRSAGLLLVDLDRFKEVNDTLGHHVGDVLLLGVSNRLGQEIGQRFHGRVARLGGDEFGVWLEGLEAESVAQSAAAHTLSVLTKPFEIEGYRLELGASIGIAIAPRHAASVSGLLRCADVAMYAAKARGAGFAVYEASQDPYSQRRLTLLSELGGAVGRGEMRLAYQPRVSLATNSLRGFEALIRWQHPRLGVLMPAAFIPLAELSDVIRPLTQWVLGEALRQLRSWRDAGGAVRISVNLSARQLLDNGFPEQIERLLREHGVDPGALELEITESAIIADPERAGAVLARIRALGVQIAVDDFGTGYSSLSHLKRLPLHALKIDVSFVRQMLSNAQDRVIVESTIGLAHNLGLTIVAEGVEDEATDAALRASGCDEGQGYFYSQPLDAQGAGEWVRRSVTRKGSALDAR